MHIRKLAVNNFRLLSNVELLLETSTTVIVGRNNCCKTSLTELFRRLIDKESPKFLLEDFSLSAHEAFWTAYTLATGGSPDNDVRTALPFIQVTLTVEYDAAETNLGTLGDFIIDLDPACTTAVIVLKHELSDGSIAALFKDIVVAEGEEEGKKKQSLCRALRERVPDLFTTSVLAVDPNDQTNTKAMTFADLKRLIQGGFITAQRGLDDNTEKERHVLGRVLEAFLTAASSDTAGAADKKVVDDLESAVKTIQDEIDEGFNVQLQGLFPAFSLFGYPGLSDPGLRTETTLDVKRLLTNHTKVHYAGLNGVNLPESYNGLGARNLIYMLLRLLEFFKAFMANELGPGLHLIFVEEPEVHLHPQMQEVFVEKLAEIAAVFEEQYKTGRPWPVQFVVTTHSSHVANRAAFKAMRYFLAKPDGSKDKIRSTSIKNVQEGLGGVSDENIEFLHKYMTLTKCDLLFADKAVLIEGPTERLLLPMMISKTDEGNPTDRKLARQYVSVVEVGGAFTQQFFNLLSFLELRTLVITDLDSVKLNANKRYAKCPVSEGVRTSNECIKSWFNNDAIAPSALSAKTSADKCTANRRIAYQIAEKKDFPCGRSFEAAFILANLPLFGLATAAADKLEALTWDASEDVEKKTSFALKYAIKVDKWSIPLYISEGLKWLAEGDPIPAVVPNNPLSCAAAPAAEHPDAAAVPNG